MSRCENRNRRQQESGGVIKCEEQQGWTAARAQFRQGSSSGHVVWIEAKGGREGSMLHDSC